MGKIGKPQKSKKQKKVKQTYDNEFSRQTNLTKKSSLRNLAPENDDYQEIPRKVKNIVKSQQELKKKKDRKKKLKQQISLGDNEFRMERGMSRPLKPAPRFVQGQRETDQDFMKRVSLETHRVLMKAQIEEKYKVDITEPGSGKTVIKKQKSERKKQRDREKKKKKSEALKEKRQDRKGDFSQFTDNVKFGEVAMEPPNLTAKPRKADVDSEKAKPGKRNLLLNKLMEDDKVFSSAHSQKDSFSNKPKPHLKRETGKTVKRKFLSPAQQRITDSQRQRAIDMYRKIKDKQIKR